MWITADHAVNMSLCVTLIRNRLHDTGVNSHGWEFDMKGRCLCHNKEFGSRLFLGSYVQSEAPYFGGDTETLERFQRRTYMIKETENRTYGGRLKDLELFSLE